MKKLKWKQEENMNESLLETQLTETKTETKTETFAPLEGYVSEVTVEKPIQKNDQTTMLMMQMAKEQLPPAAVTGTAEGQPALHEEAPRFSWKKWKRDRQKAAIARDHGCQVATAISYDLVQQLKGHERIKENVRVTYLGQSEETDQSQETKVDGRLLRSFCRGFELNENGQPLTEQDAENKRLDDAFCADYGSKCLEYRVPHLNRMVQEVFSIQITKDILSEENLRSRATELEHWGSVATAMDNVMADEINKPYFDQMDPQKKTELRERLAALVQVSAAFAASLNCHGVKRDGTYNKNVDAGMSAEYRGRIEGYMQDYHGKRIALQGKWKEAEKARKTFLKNNRIFQTYAKELKEISKLSKDQIEEAAENYKWKAWQKDEIFDRLKAELDLTEAEKESVYMVRGAFLMKEGVTHEEENRQTLLLLREMQKCGTENKPSADLYLRAKEMLMPRVNKVLDLDVEKWKNMSAQELVSHMEELNELFMDGMFVADLMKLKHPYQENVRSGQALTLKDELVGQRSPEYSYKSSVVRALAEKARTLAIVAKAGNEGRFEDTDYTDTEQIKMQDGKEAFLNRRMEMAANLLKGAEEKYHKTFTPGTAEFSQYLSYLNLNSTAGLIVEDMRYAEVCKEFEERKTAEAAQAMKRLKETQYYTLRYSEAELRKKGMKVNIGEGIFRSFKSFLGMEAARKLLTPDAFRQMLLDLGAGAGLHKGEWEEKDGEKTTIKPGSSQEELEEAIQKNDRGLATYKKVISAQMDMMARKYGGKLEGMKIREMLEHCLEMAADCSDGQVMMGMCSIHPDMLDLQSNDINYLKEEHPAEDKLLLARVIYYNLTLKFYGDMTPMLAIGEMKSDQELQECFDAYVRSDARYKVVREYLEQNDPLFKQIGDWSQKVEAPAQ